MSSNETLLSGRYLLQALQGSGGMAVIYKAFDQALGRTVAVKVLRPSIANDPMFIARFKNEARAIANLAHPNIVTVHDVGEHQSATGLTHYMVMEYVDGSDLKKVIRDAGMLSVDFALNYAIQICAGIGFAHRSQIVHADVKPQNVLLTQRDRLIKVTDFGIAQALSDTQTTPQKESVVWGSPHYFSPEQARGEKPTAASDVYSIGIVMFEMLAGQLPFTGTNQQELALAHLRNEVPMVTDFNPKVPEALAKTIYKVMSKEPSARYRTADQLGHILISLRDKARDHTVNVPPPPPPSAQQTQKPAPPASAADRQPPSNLPGAGQTGGNTPPPMPPSVSQAQQRPAATPPPAGMPTQRYSVAPEAPNPDPYNRQGVVQPVRPLHEQFGGQPQPLQQGQGNWSSPPPPQSGQTGVYDPRMAQMHRQQPQESLMDGVTIALAVIAFIALLGLIVLYLAVFQSYAL